MPELQQLRAAHAHVAKQALPTGGVPAAKFIPAAAGLQLEIKAEFTADFGSLPAGKFGLLVLAAQAPGGGGAAPKEYTAIAFDSKREQVLLDRSHSGRALDEDVRAGPWPEPGSRRVSLHAYVDHAVVELIANATSVGSGGKYLSDSSTPIAAWVSPTSAASSGVALFSEVDGVTLSSLDVWQLTSPTITSSRSAQKLDDENVATVSSADGKLSLKFDGSSGRLLSLEAATNSSAKLSRKAVGAAGWSVVAMAGVGDGAKSASVSKPAGGGICISRKIGPLAVKGGTATVRTKDCFAPAAAGRPSNAVEWTSTISSDAAALFSVQIGRGLSFAPRSAEGEQIWTGSDNVSRSFLLGSQSQAQLGSGAQWLGGSLTTSGMHATSGAYAFSPNKIAVPAAMLGDAPTDSGLVFALDLQDKLSTRLSLNTSFSADAAAVGFSYGAYRLGGGSAPLVFHADIAAVPADPRAALQYLTHRWPAFFAPAVPAAKTLASGTGWYTKCGPAVGGCDLQGTNETFAAELKEINFRWVWNNNFFEYFMGNYIPPVTSSAEIYTSDAGGAISVDLLRARNRGFRSRNVTELPYFSLMEFGGGPAQYAMRCPETQADADDVAAVPPSPTTGPGKTVIRSRFVALSVSLIQKASPLQSTSTSAARRPSAPRTRTCCGGS